MKRKLNECSDKSFSKRSRRCGKKSKVFCEAPESETSKEPQDSVKNADESGIQEEEKGHPWTAEEDQLIENEVKKAGTSNWKTICKHLNSKFVGKHRAPEECELRWNKIMSTASHEIPWTEHEELILLLAFFQNPGDWGTIATSLPDTKDVRSHFSKLLLDIAKRAKEQRYNDLETFSQLRKLQTLLCIDLLINSLRNTDPVPEVIEVVQQTQLEEGHCSGLLRELGRVVNPALQWDKETLEQFLDDSIEKLQNAIYASITDVAVPEDIMHVRQDNPSPVQGMPIEGQGQRLMYYWMPASYAGQAYYFLVLYADQRPQL